MNVSQCLICLIIMSTVVNNKTHHQAFGKSFIIEKRKKGKRREQCFIMANLKQLGLFFFLVISIIVPITEIFKRPA